MGLPNPITAVGNGLQNVGQGLGGVLTTSRDWERDRAEGAVRGDTFGTGRREIEGLRRNFEEKLGDRDNTLADLRDRLGGNAVAGKGVDGADLTDAASKSVHGKCGTGALSKEIQSSYTVTDGDTLYDIAQDKGKSLEDLLGLNPELGDGNLIHPGQEIKLDDFVAQDSPAGRIHTLATPAAAPETGAELQT